MQRFTDASASTYFAAVGMYGQMTGDHESHELCKYRSRYANMLPYRKLKEVVDRQMGDNGYSSGQLQKKTLETASEVSRYELDKYAGSQLCLPFVETGFDVYRPDTDEVLLFEDGIGVKRQKDKRCDGAYEKPTKRVQSDIIAIQQDTGCNRLGYRYLSPLTDTGSGVVVDMTERLSLEWSRLYAGRPVRLVVISDGARNIRKRLEAVFGKSVTIILDWFHLKKRVNETMSMMGFRKDDKKAHIKQILHLLWTGEYGACIQYIEELKPHSKRLYKQKELIAYLDKHKDELINYELRQSNGKKIGSGKSEVTVNQVIGSRQKKKGMSWTPQGSHSLGVLKCLELNDETDAFWNRKKAVA